MSLKALLSLFNKSCHECGGKTETVFKEYYDYGEPVSRKIIQQKIQVCTNCGEHRVLQVATISIAEIHQKPQASIQWKPTPARL